MKKLITILFGIILFFNVSADTFAYEFKFTENNGSRNVQQFVKSPDSINLLMKKFTGLQIDFVEFFSESTSFELRTDEYIVGVYLQRVVVTKSGNITFKRVKPHELRRDRQP